MARRGLKGAARRREGKSALELAEEATHLLRGAPPSAFAAYYLGALPFALGFLYFWVDMARSPFAYQHLTGAALAVAALFLFMKFWHSVFARILRSSLSNVASPSLKAADCWRLFVSQTILQATGLFLMPLALIPVLPWPWVYAFYQNVTVLADAESHALLPVAKKAARHATLWPTQNHILLAVMLAFGTFVFLNWATVCFLFPKLLKMLLGIETVFSRSPLAMLNSTFFMAVCTLTYLCVDPLLKTVYLLRCFYGESLQSGEDLKADLRQFSIPAPAIAACIVFLLCSSSSTFSEPTVFAPTGSWQEGRGEALHAVTTFGFAEGEPASSAPASPPSAESSPPETSSSVTISPPVLDKEIQRVIEQRKYSWRAPREKVLEADTDKPGVISRFIDSVLKTLRRWAREFFDWLAELLRKLLAHPWQTSRRSSGYGWIVTLQILFYVLIALVVGAIGYFIYLALTRSGRLAEAIIAEPVQPVPNLADENIGAEQLPEDGWTKLANELLQRGEFRLALRAFYLASLAHLAGRNLVSLAKFKSNHDYERELQRRGHSFPELLRIFGENVSVFERIWYGLHEINAELVRQFAANVEKIRSGGLVA